MIRHVLAVAAISALGSACGGASPGPSATVTGTIRGQSFTPKDAQSTTGTVVVGENTIQAASIVISDSAGLCANASAGKEPRSSHYLVIVLSKVTPELTTAVATSPGDYFIFNGVGNPPSATFGVIFAQATDTACKDVPANDAIAVSGTVHVSSVSNGAYAGFYDAQLAPIESAAGGGATEHVKGTFNTAFCAGLAPAVSLTRSFTCF